MNHRVLIAALATAGALAWGSQAAASGFTITYSGAVESGFDPTNIFGLGNNAFLGGQAFSMSETVDYSQGAPHDIGAPYDYDLIGGAGFITSSLTLNGVTLSVGSQTGIDDRTDYSLSPYAGDPTYKSGFGVYAGDESFTNYIDPITQDQMLDSQSVAGGLYGNNFNYHPVLGMGPPVFTAADNLDLYGSFNFFHALSDHTTQSTIFENETYGNFTADRVTITTFDSGGVPEPAAWALMLLGFGGLGSVLRRRRAATALA